jgi:hypothetical protein
MSPRVTVLVPVYNGERYLREALDSVFAQTFEDYELLIINDGSTDRSVEIIRGYQDPRIRLVDNAQNQGVIATLNHGLELARGHYIARHDADDVMAPTRLAKQLALLEAEADVVVVGTWVDLVDAEGRVFGQWQYPVHSPDVAWGLLFNAVVSHPTATFRAAPVRAIGGYRGPYRHAEDYDLWSRLAAAGRMTNIPEVLVKYRMHALAISTVSRGPQEQMRCTISRRNLEDVLRGAVGAELLEILTDERGPRCADEAVAAIDAYWTLVDHFARTHGLDARARERVRDLALRRVGGKLQHLNTTGRLSTLLRRGVTFPGRFWFTRGVGVMVLGDDTRQRIKAAIGVRETTIKVRV